MSKKNDTSITKKILLCCKKEIFWKLIISILLRGTLMIIPIFYSYAVDGLSKKDFSLAYIMILISIGITILYRLSEHFNQVSYYKLYNKIYSQYNNFALSYTYKNSIYSLSRINLGEFTNIFNSDIDIISTFWATSVIRLIQLLEFVFIYIYFFLINVYIGFITIGISLIAFLILFLYKKKIRSLSESRKENLDKKTGVLQELFLGLKEIKGLNIFSPINKRSEVALDNYLESNGKYNVKCNKNKFISLFSIELFRLILFLYSIYLIIQGHMEIGTLLIIYNYYSKIIENFTEIGNINIEYSNLKTSEMRLHKLLQYSRNIDYPLHDIRRNHIGKVAFENILYGNKENPILKDISFTINPRSITVIKSEQSNSANGIFDLLLRLNRQHEGSIKIDNVDINKYNNEEYYDLVSCARKQPVFFSVSIKENLQIIEPDFVKIVDVCKKLEIHDNIMNLKNGYDTLLTDTNDDITANVRTLLAIARLLLKDSKIMLFDESVSNLDRASFNNVVEILHELKKKHTIVIISKYPEILELADKIIMIEKDKVIEEEEVTISVKDDKLINKIVNNQ